MVLLAGVAGFGADDLGAAAALGEIGRGFLPGVVVHLDLVDDVARAGGPGHSRSGGFALDHGGAALDGGHSALDADGEAFGGALGAGEARADGLFEFGVGERARGRGLGGCRCDTERNQKKEAQQTADGRAILHERTVGCAVYNSHMSSALLDRRSFLRGAGSTAAAFTAASYSRVLGANDRVGLGVIGPGDRGRFVMSLFQKDSSIEVVALADIYAGAIDKAKEKAPNAKAFTDHRKLLEMKEVAIVLVATPDHWHAQTTIDALNAGKDVYVEKPLTLKIEEGPEIVKAARVNERICQVGMQQRSGPHYIEAKREYIDKGRLGKITLARTWWHGNSYHLRRAPDYLQTKPSNLDWGRFLGPVKWRDYDPQQYWNWRAYLDFGGGQVTDLFTHWIDVVHMFLGRDVPTSAAAAGGVYAYKDGRTAPDTINVLLEYGGEFTATFEATLVPGITGAAVEFCGTDGRLWIDRGRYEFHSVDKGEKPVIVKAPPQDITLDHVNNFLECVRTRKLPNGDVLIGHRSAQASHLGNIAYVEKRRLDFDPMREEILPG